MDQKLAKMCHALAEDPSLILCAHGKQLTTNFNSSSSASSALYWHPQALHSCE